MKDIPGYEGRYQIDESGNVYSLSRDVVCSKGILRKRKLLKLRQHKNHKGYQMVSLYDSNQLKKGYSVHRLVAITYIPNVEILAQINHKDGDKQNNHVSNLEWISNTDNIRHSFKFLGRKAPTGSVNGMARSVIDLRTGIYYGTFKEAAQARDVNVSTLRNYIKKGINEIVYC